MIEPDKLFHFAAGLLISFAVGRFYGIGAGIFAAMLAEALKIVAYDMPRTDAMDWHEKGMDVLAQAIGAVVGAIALTVLF